MINKTDCFISQFRQSVSLRPARRKALRSLLSLFLRYDSGCHPTRNAHQNQSAQRHQKLMIVQVPGSYRRLKHSRFEAVALILRLQFEPGTRSNGTPAPWSQRREEPCNFLRTTARASRFPGIEGFRYSLTRLKVAASAGVVFRYSHQRKGRYFLHVSGRIAAANPPH